MFSPVKAIKIKALLDKNINTNSKENDIMSDIYIFNICKVYCLNPSIIYPINYNLLSAIHGTHIDEHLQLSIRIIKNCKKHHSTLYKSHVG
jgi:hypothetical protein